MRYEYVFRKTTAYVREQVRSLLERQEPESMYLEHNSQLSISSDSNKKQLCGDVSSFASTYRGTIISNGV